MLEVAAVVPCSDSIEMLETTTSSMLRRVLFGMAAGVMASAGWNTTIGNLTQEIVDHSKTNRMKILFTFLGSLLVIIIMTMGAHCRQSTWISEQRETQRHIGID